MNFKSLTIGAALGAALFATNAMAAEYECDIRLNGLNGGIAPVLIFSTNKEESDIFVYDGMIKHYHGKPLQGKIAVANTKRITFKWSVDVVSDSIGQSMPRIDYRATYLKQTRKITVTGRPAGWDNLFSGTGKCKRTK